MKNYRNSFYTDRLLHAMVSGKGAIWSVRNDDKCTDRALVLGNR